MDHAHQLMDLLIEVKFSHNAKRHVIGTYGTRRYFPDGPVISRSHIQEEGTGRIALLPSIPHVTGNVKGSKSDRCSFA